MAETAQSIISSLRKKAAPPSVLQVLPALETGGVERGTVQMAQALNGADWRPLVASAGGAMTRELTRIDAAHFELPLASKNYFRVRANANRLAELIENEGVDLVHARSRAPAWSALKAARLTGVPFVTTCHSPYGHNWAKHWYNKVMVKGDRVIAISNFVAELMQRRYKLADDVITVIPRGVDRSIFHPSAVSGGRMIALAKAWRLPDDRPVVMLPARLTRWKGHTVLLEALAKLGRRDISCILVGSDQGRESYRAELERLIRKYDLESVAWCVGECRDMAAAYMLADVVVSASTEPEGFGRVAIEAQAMGRPLIATDHGGSAETVIPGKTGWLVPPGDVDILADALDATLTMTAEERQWMADNAMANVAEKFTVELMCERTLDVYRALLVT
jgi:glycosyltransferase involved in cell wall biosynthesis